MSYPYHKFLHAGKKARKVTEGAAGTEDNQVYIPIAELLGHLEA